MYGIGGERRLTEFELSELPGYEGSRPVRVGNAASEQFQLDVYGEVVHVMFIGIELLGTIDERLWPRWLTIVEHVEKIWREPDDGIWESRGPRRHYTYSKVMAWVVFDRAVRVAERFGMDAPLDRWKAIRDEIHREVCERGYDPQRRTFTQYYGSRELDASVLNLPLVGFLPGIDERVTGTIDAISRELGRDGFVSRYSTAHTDDGLPGDEGQFLACSFWLVSALALNGRVGEAHALFDRLLGLANDLGLLAEEYDVARKRQVGNFPQAFSHLTLILAARGSKLTDRWGRKRCFLIGLTLYGIGAILSALSPGLGTLILGNSVFEGVGTALLIPPVYILTTLAFSDLTSRARAFGIISGMGGIGAAAGPLIGGIITTAISWRAAFVFQAAVVATIVFLARRRIVDPLEPDPTRPFDTVGAVLSAVGMFFVVFGILQAENSLALMAASMAVGAGFLVWFFLYIRSQEREGREPLLSTALFKNRTSNLGLATQNIQWLLLLGTSFVVSVYLQTVRGYDAIETGVIFTAATVGVLASSLAAERLAKKYSQANLIRAGFIGAIAGIALLLALVSSSSKPIAFVPGLLLIGLGVGVLTPSVNVVQSSLPEQKQGEISGLSRSVSNLGSSFGTAIAGTILVSDLVQGNRSYALAMVALAVLAFIGLLAAFRLPANPERAAYQ